MLKRGLLGLLWVGVSATAVDFVLPGLEHGFGLNQMRAIILNPSSTSVQVSWECHASDGSSGKTFSAVLQPCQRLSLGAEEMGFENAWDTGWLGLHSDGDLCVLGELSGSETQCAFWASTKRETGLVIPHVATRVDQFETQVNVVNGFGQGLNGQLIAETLGAVADLPQIPAFGQLQILAEPWFDDLGGSFEWARVVAPEPGICGMETFRILPELDQTAALDLDGVAHQRLIFVHLAEDVSQYWTGLVLVNVNEDPVDVELVFHGRQGDTSGAQVVLLEPGSKHSMLFDASHTTPEGTSWVEVTTDRDALVGYEVFGAAHSSSHRFMAGLRAATETSRELVFPNTETTTGEWAGLVLVNAGDCASSLVLEAFNDAGTRLAQMEISGVNPGGKITGTMEQFFGSSTASACTWVRARSQESSWVGAALWGDTGETRHRLSGVLAAVQHGAPLYFPPLGQQQWETADAEALGWDIERIPDLLAFLDQTKTRAFLVLKDGRMVIEHYAHTNVSGAPFDAQSLWYWASAGKTLTATLVGIAQQRGLIDIHRPTAEYLGAGWTGMDPDQEGRITVWHQLTMTSGLDDRVPDSDCTNPECLQYRADPGTRWCYHNAPYTRLDGVIEGGSGLDFDAFFDTYLKKPIGMDGFWAYQDYNHVFFSTPRSMARFGLLILNRGVWEGTPILDDLTYFQAMVSTSQQLNLSYGYLWWLNGKDSFMAPGLEFVFPGSLAPHAPLDMVAAMGKNGQLLQVIPSENLVVVRMGDSDEEGLVGFALQDQIWERLMPILHPTER